MKASRRISLALAMSLILFLPIANAANTITLTSPNAVAAGGFGASVAVNEGDSFVVVGAPQETAGPAGGQSQAGNAYVLETATGIITTLTSPTPQADGRFGSSVSASGATVVVGARGEIEGNPAKTNAGHAYVFDATSGSLITTLTSPTPETDGRFGSSVSASGATVVVGAPFESAGVPTKVSAGHAYVFDATSGSLITTLTSPNVQGGGGFGWSVAVSGTTVVVGAPFETTGGNAYVFDATTNFLIPTTLTSLNPQGGGNFGWSVAVSGTTVVVGALSESAGVPAQSGAGHAYVFDATLGFLTPTTLTSPYAQAGGEFGQSVAVGGKTVVVGAVSETVGSLTFAGHAYSFDGSTGFLTTTLTSPNPQTFGDFGFSVSVTEIDPIVVVGAIFESGGGSTFAGHAYIFF